MQSIKEDANEKLFETGRRLVEEKGAGFLTARKLSEASGYSIGSIYNRFGSMEDFVAKQNEQTLRELEEHLNAIVKNRSSYQNLNDYVDGFVEFVLKHGELWFLLYNFHLNNKSYRLPQSYKKQLVRLTAFALGDLKTVFSKIEGRRLRATTLVLYLSLMSASAMLTTNVLDNISLVNKNNLCKILVNTYLAGMMVLNND